MATGHWQWSAWLTPKGRTIAVFALLRIAPDTIHLLLPDMPAGAFAEQLQRFVFRRKVKIAVRQDLRVFGAMALPASAHNARIAQSDGGPIELDMGCATSPRSLHIAAEIAGPTTIDDDAMARWKAADLRFGLPRLPAAQREQWTPQQLALDRLHAYSVKKGCYPGQEIVARTHFLGKAKRSLTLLETPAGTKAGDEVQQAGAMFGMVACVAASNPMLALAVVPMDQPTKGLTINGAPAHAMPLADGLAR